MAITEIWQTEDSNSVSVTLESRKYTAAVMCRSNDPKDTGLAVVLYMLNNGYGYGSYYQVGNDFDIWAIIYQIDPPRRVAGSCELWKTLVHYKLLQPEDRDQEDGQPNSPIDIRPRIETSSATREVAVNEATYRSGFDAAILTAGASSPIINSAKAILTPQPTEQRSNLILSVSRNMLSVNLNSSAFPTDFVNTASLTLTDRQTTVQVPQYGMKHLSWRTSPATIEDVDLVKVTGEFELQESGWRRRFRDEGFSVRAEAGDPDGKGGIISPSELRAGVPQIRRMLDQFGMPVSDPVRLDGNGRPLGPAAATVYSTWSTLDEIDVTTLPIFAGMIV